MSLLISTVVLFLFLWAILSWGWRLSSLFYSYWLQVQRYVQVRSGPLSCYFLYPSSFLPWDCFFIVHFIFQIWRSSCRYHLWPHCRMWWSLFHCQNLPHEETSFWLQSAVYSSWVHGAHDSTQEWGCKSFPFFGSSHSPPTLWTSEDVYSSALILGNMSGWILRSVIVLCKT